MGLSAPDRYYSGEYWALVLFATAGMMLLASAGDLIVVFLALELMSLSLYVLAGLFKRELASGEAAMKYFLLGAFASSFLLYGIALIYGATGTTNLDRIAAATLRGPAIHVRHRPRPLDGRVRVQDLLGALPHVGARRVSGRADERDGADRDRLQGRRLRGLDPRVHGDPARHAARLGGALVGDRRGHDDGRQLPVVALGQSNLKRILTYSSSPTSAICWSASWREAWRRRWCSSIS